MNIKEKVKVLPLLIIKFFVEIEYPWTKLNKDGLVWREYESYQKYLAHQKHKSMIVKRQPNALELRTNGIREGLKNSLVEIGIIKPGMSVLCLGARSGGECLAFQDLGCFAIGIDVSPVPVKENELVLYGDFQKIAFPAKCLDVVYTNSLDHAFDLSQVVSEVARVLKPGGIFLVDAIKGFEYHEPRKYESFWWENNEKLLKHITKNPALIWAGGVNRSEKWDTLIFKSKNIGE